jgi:hypothetical protein
MNNQIKLNFNPTRYDSSLYRVMTWKEACNEWDEEILPIIQEAYESDGIPDWPARREGWNNWTDSLCKDGQISDWQYANWSQPESCGD